MNGQVLAEQLGVVHGLDNAQVRYLEELSAHVADLPAEEKSALLEEAAELLAERPSQQWDELVDALGSPKDFAATWVAEHYTPALIPSRNAFFRRPRNLAGLTILALLAGVGLWTLSYFTAEPDISTPCRGARGPSVETLEAAGQTEYQMPLVIDARYGVHVCLQAHTGDDENREVADVVFHRIYLNEPVDLAIQPVGWEIVVEGNETGDASSNRFTSIDPESPWLAATVWFEGDRCNMGGGGSTGFGALQVDYSYRGRERTATLDLGAQYSITSSEDQCTETNFEADDALYDRWIGIVGDHFFNHNDLSENGHMRLGSVELWPENVSRDLCRYLRGVTPPENSVNYQIEPLEERAVFRAQPEDARLLIDGAVLGICPEFADQRDFIQALVPQA